ncbi:MAG: CvpA family protein [Candidatus Omnitrophica bacterium]|nr:CvpA family protein [Candidatus Omnitrophota bacterium]
MLNILKQFNWLDVFILILIFRILYISIKSGLSKEFFKLLGVLSATYLSLHYFTVLSDLICKNLPVKKMPLEFFDFLLFTVLAILGYLVFVLLRTIFNHFIKMEAVPLLEKWGGLVMGILRSFFLPSLIIFMLAISSVGYLKKSAQSSYLGKKLFDVAPDTYSWFWNSITSKFMKDEKFNNNVLNIKEGFKQE